MEYKLLEKIHHLQRGTLIYEKLGKAVFCTFRLVLSCDAMQPSIYRLKITINMWKCRSIAMIEN